MVEYQKQPKVNEEKLGEVGLGWSKGFTNRYPLLLSKIVVKYGTKRSEWVRRYNITLMYHQSYDALVKYMIVVDLEDEFF